MSEKEYILGELEKLASDKDYYLQNQKKTKVFIDKNYTLLHKLKEFKLEKNEIKIISKTNSFMEKLKKILK